jgi:hypothetical protein
VSLHAQILAAAAPIVAVLAAVWIFPLRRKSTNNEGPTR